MRIAAVLVVLLLLSGRSYACKCAQEAFPEIEAREANRVFIFRLVAAKPEEDPPGIGYGRNPSIVGTVRIVDSLKGHGPEVERIRFQNSSCCGVRLDVGHYFIAFTSRKGRELDATDALVVNVNDEYFEGLPEIYLREGFVGRLHRMLLGELTLEDVLPVHVRRRISTAPWPPPPPPCPKTNTGET